MHSVDPQGSAGTYAAVLDALPIVAYMARADGTISYVSAGYEELTGNSLASLVGDGYASIIHPDDLKSVGVRWATAVASGVPYADDFRIRVADGTYRWITSRADSLREYDRIVGWFGTLTDIDDRKRAEAALSKSESTYRAFSAAIPGVTWAASPDGDLTLVSEGFSALHGKPRDGALGASWLETVHPDDRARVNSVWAQSLTNGEPYDIQFRLRVVDGSYHWFLVRALPVRDDAGAIVQWVGVNVDIDQQRRADESREQFVQLVDNSDDLIGIFDARGMPLHLNAAGLRLLEIDSLDAARARPFIDFVVADERAVMREQILPAVERDGRWLGEVRLQNFRTREPIPFSSNVFAMRDERGEFAGFATVSHDARNRHRIESGLRMLADTGAVMFESLDFEQTLRNVATAATRDFASYCVFDMFGGDGKLAPIASIHTDPALLDALERSVRRRLIGANHHVMLAARDGRSTLVTGIDAEWLRGRTDASRDDLAALAARSMMCVPMRAGINGDVIGALTLVIDARNPRGEFSERDVHFAEEVGRRAGIAFNHAKVYERERRIAVALQEAALPKQLPAPAGLLIDAAYRQGNAEATIGGDWYDAFVLDDGRVVFTIGDVMGSGLAAAVTMAKLRQAMQSVGLLTASLDAMLDAADRTARSISSDSYATALAAIYDPVRREMAFASAGHPAPALRRPDGSVEFIEIAGTMLGMRLPGPSEVRTFDVPPGSAVVLYTDGLIESSHDMFAGLSRLHAALQDGALTVAAAPARALVERVLENEPAVDDVAVLVALIS